MALCREASFAPVLAVLPFDTVEDALEMNAKCRYGLGASIFTRAPARAEQMAAQLRAGMLTINDVIAPTGRTQMRVSDRKGANDGNAAGARGSPRMLCASRSVAEDGSHSFMSPSTIVGSSAGALATACSRCRHCSRRSDRLRPR